MVGFLKKLPMPISGLMLGLAALGNLLGAYSPALRFVCGSLSGMILIFILLKLIRFPNSVKENFLNPVTAGVMQTLPMTLILLSGYTLDLSKLLSFMLWGVGLILSIALIIAFTFKHVFSFNIQKVFPTYFVLYVGMVAGSVTAPIFDQLFIGQFLFWIGFIFYMPLIPLVLYRVIKIKGIPQPARNTLAIFAAPASLLLAGYLSSFQEKSHVMILGLTTLALFMTLYVVIQLPSLLRLKFYPSMSGLTFPFVISAIALKMSLGYLQQVGYKIAFLEYVLAIEILLATAMVVYVFIRYCHFMIADH